MLVTPSRFEVTEHDTVSLDFGPDPDKGLVSRGTNCGPYNDFVKSAAGWEVQFEPCTIYEWFTGHRSFYLAQPDSDEFFWLEEVVFDISSEGISAFPGPRWDPFAGPAIDR